MILGGFDIMVELDEIELLKLTLSKHFYIREEVEGVHVSGKRVRIDALIVPKEYDQWKNGKQTVFGLEFKKQFDSISDRTKLIVQAIDYRNSKFYARNGDLLDVEVFVYPNPVLDIQDRGFYDRLLGRIGIGFMYFEHRIYGGTMLFMEINGNKIWDSVNGTNGIGKKMNFYKKIGSQ